MEEEFFRQIFLNSPAVKLLIDIENGDLIEANQAAAKFYGFSVHELRNMKIFDINISEPELIFRHMQSVNTSYGSTFYSQHRFKTGEIRDVEVYAGLIKYKRKKYISLIVFDNTAKRHVEAKKKKIEERLDFAYKLHQRSELLNSIIFSSVNEDKTVLAIAKNLDLDLSVPFFFGLIYLGNANNVFVSEKKKLKDLNTYRNDIIERLENLSDSIVWDCRSDIGIMCWGKRPCDVEEIFSFLKELHLTENTNLKIVIGVSDNQYIPAGLAMAYRQAWSALLTGRLHQDKGIGVYHFCNIGVAQLLTNFSNIEQTMDFVEDKLGALIEYDRQKGTNYLVTLENIIQENNLKNVAEKMFLHYKTLIFRKKRIEKILGYSLDEYEATLVIGLAIKLHNLNKVIKRDCSDGVR